MQRFSLGVSPHWDEECDQLLCSAVSGLSKIEQPRGHVVLILDKVVNGQTPPGVVKSVVLVNVEV